MSVEKFLEAFCNGMTVHGSLIGEENWEEFIEAVLKAREMGCFEEFEDILAQGEDGGYVGGVPEGSQGSGDVTKLKGFDRSYGLPEGGMTKNTSAHHYSGDYVSSLPLLGALQCARGVSSTSVPGTGLNKDSTESTTIHEGSKVVRTYVSADFHALLKTLKFATGLTFPEITDIITILLLNKCKEAFEKAFGLRWER